MKILVFLLLPCLSLSEVGDNFNNCRQFFFNGVSPQFTPAPTGNSVKQICQCVWDDDGVIRYLYATLYNTALRIPIYSAYEFESGNTGRCDPWYIEPQLDGGNNADPCMGPQDPDQPIGANQALNRDYYKSGYDKGHLYPVQHTGNHLSMLATSTLTNAAPQDPGFNRGAWNKHEKDVSDKLKTCKKAFVVTGVVPDLNKQKIPFNNANNNNKYRVTVSKYYWRATCCQDNNDKFTGQGYYGPDNGVMEVKKLSITELQTNLTKDYGVNKVDIFPGVSGGCI